MATTIELEYGSKAWPEGFVAKHDMFYHYNYLELEEEGVGVNDEPLKVPFLTGSRILSKDYKPNG